MAELEFEVEWASRRDYGELMEFLQYCFQSKDPNHDRFEDAFPDLYQDSEGEMSWNLVARHNDKIIGCVGVFPIKLMIWGDLYEIGGIGGVSTHPEYRQQGVMRELMCQAMMAMENERDYSMAWLSGDRFRYRPWGFETVCNHTRYEIGPRGPAVRYYYDKNGWELTSSPLEENEWVPVWKELSANRVLSACGSSHLRKKYARCSGHYTVWRAKKEGHSGMVVILRDPKPGQLPVVTGWAGDPDAIGVILARYVADQDCRIAVYAPPGWHDCRELFNVLQVSSGLVARGSVAILQLVRCLQMYQRYLHDRVRRLNLQGVMQLAMSGYHGIPDQRTTIDADGEYIGIHYGEYDPFCPKVRLDCWQSVELIFSPTGQDYIADFPKGAGWVGGLFPLPFYLPPLYNV